MKERTMPKSPWSLSQDRTAERIRRHPLYGQLVRCVAQIEATHIYGRYGGRLRFYTKNGSIYYSELRVPSSQHDRLWRRAYRRADLVAGRMIGDVFITPIPGGVREMRAAMYHVARTDVDARRLGIG